MLRAVPKPRTETRTMERLRAQMKQVETIAQFERIVAQAHEDHRGAMRKLLEPMLPAGLPCCAQALLAKKAGRKVFHHGVRCPSRNLVVLQ